MSGKQLCPASSKGMKERSSGSAAASGRRGVLAPRATEGRIQLPFLPSEDPPLCARPPGLPAPEARSPPLPEHPETGLGPPLDFRVAVAVEAALQCPRSSF